ncbi:MAG: rRNA maturation RNase YbeY [Planctomycetota bacterium]|nr:rRNA maturation RNase YbeY [Planctomycetota bacterium]
MLIDIDRNSGPDVPSDELIISASDMLLEREDVMLPDGRIEVRFCDNEQMIAMNREYLGENAITDVLAFEMLEEDPETGELLIGSIAVNYELASDKSEAYVRDEKLPNDRIENFMQAEILMYVLHGILHFAGFEDDIPAERRNMFEIAADVISKAGGETVPYDHGGNGK